MITLMGEKAMAASLARALWPARHLPVAAVPQEVPAGTALLVWCRDGRTWEEDLRTQRRLRAQPLPWLQVWRCEDEVWLGPRQQAEQVGCILCLRKRLRMNSPHKQEFDQFDQMEIAATDTSLSPFVAEVLSGLVREEAARLSAGDAGLAAEAVLSVTLATAQVRRHPLTADSTCPECGTMPADAPQLALVARRPLPKGDAQGFRVSDRPPDLARLRQQFVDYRVGVVPNEVRHPHRGWLPLSEAQLGMLHRDDREPSFGREYDYETADRVALLEALERHAGLRSLARQQSVTGTYRDLAEHALDPAALILHSPEAYANPIYSLVPYSPDLPIRWVWSYSFMQDRPLLVPEQAVYYGKPDPQKAHPRFLLTNSSGCALGGSLEEAIFYGLLEVIERDAILLAWYAQLPVRRLDLSGAGLPPAVHDMVERAAALGYRVDAFNVTSDIRVPSVMVLASRKDGSAPYATMAGGAHPDPVRALKGGIVEAIASIPFMGSLYEDARCQLPYLSDPRNVVNLEDHRLRLMMPEAREAMAHLFRDEQAQTLGEAWGEIRWPSHSDFQDDLDRLVSLVHAAGLDVLAVDQTPPELARNGLYAARVLVPGALPLTFGHELRRVDENGRVRTVPEKLGYGLRSRLNLQPHPFS